MTGSSGPRHDLLGTHVPGDSLLHRSPLWLKALLVLGLASQALRMPAADGEVYRKGEVG